MVVAIAIGFLICYVAINWLESGGKILNKLERAQSNFLWDAQMHNQTVIFVHLKQKFRYVQN